MSQQEDWAYTTSGEVGRYLGAAADLQWEDQGLQSTEAVRLLFINPDELFHLLLMATS